MTSEMWAALLGALVGGVIAGGVTWLTSSSQWKAERAARHEDRVTDLVLELERLIRRDLLTDGRDVPVGAIDSLTQLLEAMTVKTHPAFSRDIAAASGLDPDGPDTSTVAQYTWRRLKVLHDWAASPESFRA